MLDIVKNEENKIYIFLSRYRHLLILTILSIIFCLPYLINSGPSLLDDPWYYYMAKSLNIFDWRSVLTVHGGRLIPFTIIFYFFNYQLADFNFFWLVFIRLVELVTVILLIYRLAKQFLGDRLGFWCSVFLLFSSPMVTNFYELETQDHISLLLLLLFLVIYLNLSGLSSSNKSVANKSTNFVLSLFVLSCFLLTKETNIFVIFVFATLLILDYIYKQNRKTRLLHLSYLILCSVFGAVLFVYSNQMKGGIMGYGIKNVLPTTIGYAKILNLLLIFIVYSLGLFVARLKIDFDYSVGNSRWLVLCLSISIYGFSVYLPWSSAADRYLLVPWVFMSIFAFANFRFAGKKLLIFIIGLTVANNLFFSLFHFVRFYGARQSDAKLMNYLVVNSSYYDQVCMPLSVGSNENLIQMDIWLNKINKLNKKVCTLSTLAPGFFSGENHLLDKVGVLYGNKVTITSSTLVIQREATGIIDYPLDSKYIFEPNINIGYHIYNIHPVRGFEIKKFDWIIGKVQIKSI